MNNLKKKKGLIEKVPARLKWRWLYQNCHFEEEFWYSNNQAASILWHRS